MGMMDEGMHALAYDLIFSKPKYPQGGGIDEGQLPRDIYPEYTLSG
jgi:hypothetical protein